MPKSIEEVVNLLSESQRVLVNELTIYSCETGEAPLFMVPYRDHEKRETISELLSALKSLNLDNDKYGHDCHKLEDFVLMRMLEEGRYKLHLQASVDYNFFKKQISQRNSLIVSELLDGDDQGLICTENLDIDRQWYCAGGKTLFLHQAKLGSSNSVLPLSMILGKSARTYIRPDCFMIYPASNYHVYMERASAYGKPFNKEWLNSFEGVQAATHYNDGNLFSGEWTHFVWESLDKGEVQFACEELPHYESHEEIRDYTATRFMHGIYRREDEKFIHLDGALHIYHKDKYLTRLNHHLKDHYNDYIKTKIFRVDDEISLDRAQALIESFYRWNYVVPEYFSYHNEIRAT